MTLAELPSKKAVAEVTSRGKTADDDDVAIPVRESRDDSNAPAPSIEPRSTAPAGRRILIMPFLVTLTAIVLAAVLGRAMWGVYMDGPWTRDASVRAYIVRMAPEVAGRIVELPVVDNQYVRRGDLLMVVDPINYRIAVSLGEATVQQSQANVQSSDAQIVVQRAQVTASEAQVERAQAALTFAEQQAARYRELAATQAGSVQLAQQTASTLQQERAALASAQASLAAAQAQIQALAAQRASAAANLAQVQAQLSQARVNLDRSRIVSPVDGYVTNLLAHIGDFVNVGANTISVVDANSFWIDAYFEETNRAAIRVGDPARIKLMSYSQTVRGRVDSIARAINVPNAQPNDQGVATVNPIFTWVRLAQRIPIRIHIDEVPPGVVLSAGMTATVEVDQQSAPPPN
jgi:multidrug resistance efflux pump